uniref:NME/NM23 family member 8 n=1 Tax=Strigops habroptila TaxID=2489341 RepID=A0A672V3I7_STRHB
RMLKCQFILFQMIITNESQWDEMLLIKGVVVIDVYQAWCGPCKAVLNLFRKLKNEFSEDDVLHFAVAEADNILALQSFKNKCEPVFLFCVNGKIISLVKGVNAPLLSKKITELVLEERAIASGQKDHSIESASRQLAFFFPNFDTDKTEQKMEKTLALIRPCLLKERRGKKSILQRIKDDGFKIAMQKEITLTEEQIHEFYKEHVDQDYFPVLLEQMTSGPTLVLALTRENAVAHWRDLLGPKTVEEAMKENPNSLRAQYAVSNVPIGQLHGSSTPDDAQKELEFFFPQEHTLALIKPAAAAKHKDDILQKVKDAGFRISKIKEESLTREMAAQFYKDHEGKPFFEDLLSCMTEGPSVIMVLTKENAVEEWRHLMGPVDPEVAKETSPGSIRAHFAQDILSNAVHGSSTKEHAQKSIECVFGELDLD